MSKNITNKNKKIFYDLMHKSLCAGIGEGFAQDNAQSAAWRHVPAQLGAMFERITLYEDQSIYFSIYCRFADTFDKAVHNHYGIRCFERDGAVYGNTKWNLAAHGTVDPYVAAHSILAQFKTALLPEQYAKVVAEYTRLIEAKTKRKNAKKDKS